MAFILSSVPEMGHEQMVITNFRQLQVWRMTSIFHSYDCNYNRCESKKRRDNQFNNSVYSPFEDEEEFISTKSIIMSMEKARMPTSIDATILFSNPMKAEQLSSVVHIEHFQ